MYGQGNYTPQSGQELYAGPPPFQQRPPPPPPLPFQQSPQAPRPPILQHSHPSNLPQVALPGLPAYQHSHPVPSQQGPPLPVPSSGINSGQSYLLLPPPPPRPPAQVHGSMQMLHSRPTSQQLSQWTGMHQVPPSANPPTARVPPPPPSQGQTVFRGPVHQALPGGMQVLQHSAPPPPPPPPYAATSSFSRPPFGSFMQSVSQDSNVPSTAPLPPPPPPPPSSPPSCPPLPPSSPPSSSSVFSSEVTIKPASDSTNHSDFDLMIGKSSANDVLDTGSVEKVLDSDQVAEGICMEESLSKRGTGFKLGPALGKNLISELPQPPPKPGENRIVCIIETLCQSIAKNGIELEEKVRRKEFGNPDFKFLFGGKPGSETAVAYEYYEWMKKKYQLASSSCETPEDGDSGLRLWGTGPSLQPDSSAKKEVCNSLSDSDMEMEDDITQPEEDQRLSSLGNLNHGSIAITDALGTRDHLFQTSDNAAMSSMAKNAAEEKLSCDVSLELEEQRKGVSSIVKRTVSNGDSSFMNPGGVLEHFQSGNSQLYSPHQDLRDHSASEKSTGTDTVKGNSPFRLLQDYASDTSSEINDGASLGDAGAATVSQSTRADATGFDINNIGGGLGPKSPSVSERKFEFHDSSSKILRSAFEMQKFVTEDNMTFIVAKNSQGSNDERHRIKESDKDGNSSEELQEKSFLRGDAGYGSKGGGLPSLDAKLASQTLKIDEFGRLVKEDASDSESDDSQHYARRLGKRGRSMSRSRSPHDRRIRSRSPHDRRIRSRSPHDRRSRSRSPHDRRSRSRSPHDRRSPSPYDRRRRRTPPHRRKQKRGRSRSLSPRRHRSRSKSPLYRQGIERRDKAQPPQCFDFLRGKCYRGASCRFLHHDSGKNDKSRYYRSKQHQDLPPSSRRSDTKDEIETVPSRKSVHGNEEGKSLESMLHQHRPDKQGTLDTEDKVIEPTTSLSGKERSLETTPTCPVGDADSKKIAGYIQQAEGHSFDHMLQSDDDDRQKINDSSTSLLTAPTILNQIPVKPHFSQDSLDQSYTSASSTSKSLPSLPSENVTPQSLVHAQQTSDVPSAFSSVLQGAGLSFPQQMPRDHDAVSPITKFSSQSASADKCPPYQAAVPYQHSNFPMPTNNSWNSLPPPPPPLSQQSHPPFISNPAENASIGQHGVSAVECQQNMRPYPTELPSHSDVDRHRTYPPLLSTDRPPHLMENAGARMLFHMNKPANQPHNGSSIAGEDRFSVHPVQDISPLNSFAPENMLSQSMAFSRGSPSKRMHAVPGVNMPPGEPTGLSSSYSYLQRPSYGPQYPAATVMGVSVHLAEPGSVNSTMSRYRTDLLNGNQPLHLPEYGGLRISNHFNPYASTFDQPPCSKFTSNVLTEGKDMSFDGKYGTSFNLSHVSVDGQAVESLGSRNVTPPDSARAVEGILPRSSSDQYDPLYDSIEPMNISNKSDRTQKRETTVDSDMMLRLSGSYKPLDVEENNKHKGGGPIAPTASLENEEYGETADAEVGAVENGSPSSPNDAVDMVAGEIEIDQVKASGKSKKSKDSRSMKLFKVSLAEFVKEVLKPSWRQGNMSKEVFKTIVKKTVDKVSGAMKGHQVPKSEAKINHYIDSSQRKLTKLVMGYVDKYVKV